MTVRGLPRSALFPLAVFGGFLVGVLALAVLPPLLGYGRAVVVSGSMAPSLSVGDVIVLDEPRPADLAPGAIVTFRDPALGGQLVTHRIVEVLAPGRYRTRGDANRLPDSTPLVADDVVGRVVAVVPRVGGPLLWTRAEPWRTALVAVGGFAAIGVVWWWSSGPVPARRRQPVTAPASRRIVALPAVPPPPMPSLYPTAIDEVSRPPC